ncbi:hypothetical protein [Paraburkholderia agricolaris]|jgi:hypothetical protein|uniref:hypothetical protein n=1 Tax=Paraburkholderia agricolaris TaxID=2152888 RepID=UPI001FEBAC48|nr:hypothetical protein [Paraburkholderia agricolaris]
MPVADATFGTRAGVRINADLPIPAGRRISLLSHEYRLYSFRRKHLGVQAVLIFNICTRTPIMNKMRLTTVMLTSAVVVGLAACGTTQLNTIDVQNSTAKTLGLASSDELTISNVQYGQHNALGGVPVTYDATTAKGRRFSCSVFMIPGLTPINPPTYNNWECHPHT